MTIIYFLPVNVSKMQLKKGGTNTSLKLKEPRLIQVFCYIAGIGERTCIVTENNKEARWVLQKIPDFFLFQICIFIITDKKEIETRVLFDYLRKSKIRRKKMLETPGFLLLLLCFSYTLSRTAATLSYTEHYSYYY